MDNRRRGQRGPGAPAEPSGNVPALDLQDFLDHVNRGAVIEGGSKHHLFMHGAAQDALRSSPRSTPDTARPRKCGSARRPDRQAGRRLRRRVPAVLQRVR